MAPRKPRTPTSEQKKDPTAAENLAKNQELQAQTPPGAGVSAQEPAAAQEPAPAPADSTREPRQPLEQQEGADPHENVSQEDQRSLHERRAERIPMGRHERLSGIAAPYLRTHTNCYLRFAIDKPGRLEQYLSAGYEFVTDSNGKKVTFPSGSNHLYLMKLPLEFRKEDLAAREEEISSRLMQELQPHPDEYVPEGQESALTVTGAFTPAA